MDEQIHSNLSILKKISDKKDALKAQLNFRRYVLRQGAKKDTNPDIYLLYKKVGQKTVECSVEELEAKVKPLVAHCFTLPIDTTQNEFR